MPKPFVVVVAGVAGSGKTTLGKALARELGVAMIDLDTVTNPLLERMAGALRGEHWLSSEHASDIRDGRYAALRAVAHDVVATAGCAVLVAPFTAELHGGDDWSALRQAVQPAEIYTVHIVGDSALFAERRAGRAEARDAHRPPGSAPEPARIATIQVDADLTTSQQLARVLPRLGVRTEVSESSPLFAAEFDAVLFDLDGTLVDSTASVTRCWRRFAHENGVSSSVLQENHGQPARALVARMLPPESRSAGLARITALEVEDAKELAVVRGARRFFADVPDAARAIVTSGSVPIATARLRASDMPLPAVMVTVDDVTHGKPHPEPYLTAAARLGVAPERCLVVEDASAGIRSAKAAGCLVLAVAGTQPIDELTAADLTVDGLDRVRIVAEHGVLRLALSPDAHSADAVATVDS